jgi:hypothetical protein
MRLSTILLTLVLFESVSVFAQSNNDGKRDYQWLSGYTFNNFSNCRIFDFNNQPMVSYSHQTTINLGYTSTNICDTNGQLLFYTNGLKVCDKNGTLMPNGDSLSNGLYASSNQGLMTGLNGHQAAIILPMPYYGSKYIIFHQRWADTSLIPTYLLYSIVDMSQNNGLGDVISKNDILINDTIAASGLTAVRHSNNRDWWLLVPRINHNSFYRILLNPEGVWLEGEQEIGKVHLFGEYSARFSPDGTKYAYAAYCPGLFAWPTLHPAELFNFDRSNGTLSDPREFSFYDSIIWIHNIAFSPNSKLLYASLEKRIYQWDTDSYDIASTSTIVGEWDGYTWGWAPTNFSYCQLAPDNRIYLCSTTPYMHIIDKPDIPGIGCDVIQRYIHFSNDKPIIGIPNYPDFRLGSVTAVNDIASERPSILISPNPAYDYIQIQFAGSFPGYRFLDIEILDYLGRRVKTLNDFHFDDHYRISTLEFTPGLYFVRMLDENRTVSCEKFLVIH